MRRYVIEAVFEEGFETLNWEAERHWFKDKALRRWNELEYERRTGAWSGVWHYQLRDLRTGAILRPV